MNKFLKLPILAAAAAIPAALMVLGANAATNLLTNPTFDTNTAGWSLLAGWPAGTIAWDAGTLKLTNTTSDATATTATAATQCIDGITVGSTYTIKAQSFIPSGQKRHGGTQTRIFWYQGAGCTGAVLSSPQGSFNIGLDSWVTAKNDFVAPATAKSGRVMLMTEMYAVDPGEDATARFYAKWDNATFTETPVATPTPTSTPTSTPTKAPTKTPTAAPTSTSTPASGTVTPPIDPPAGPVDQGDNQADQPTDSGDGQQSGTPANPTEVPGDPGSGEVVNGLGGTSSTTPAVTKHSTESPLAPSTGTGEHGQQGGLIDWRIFLLGMLALMAVSGLAVTVGSVVRSGSDSEEL